MSSNVTAAPRSAAVSTGQDGSRLMGYVWILVTTLIFSSFEPAAKMASGILKPLQFTTLRFFIGGLVLIPFAWMALKKVARQEGWTQYIQEKRDIRDFIILGIVIATLSMTIYQFAVTLIPASVAAPILCTSPMFTTVLSFLLIKTKIQWYNWVALAISGVGIAMMFNTGGQSISTVGLVLAVVATFFLALYSVLSNRTAKRYGGLVVTCVSQLAGGIITGVIQLLGHVPPVARGLDSAGLGFFANVPFFEGITVAALPLLLYIWVVNSGLGYVTNMKAIGATSPTEASLVYFLKIGVGPLMSMALLGETVSAGRWGAIAIVTLGSMVALIPGLKSAWDEHQQSKQADPLVSGEDGTVPVAGNAVPAASTAESAARGVDA